MHVDTDGEFSLPASLRLSDRKVHFYANANKVVECRTLQMLPDRKSFLSSCYGGGHVHRMVVQRLSDGKVVHSWAQDPDKFITKMHGLLDRNHVLVSLYLLPDYRTVLGSLDLRTHAIRTIANTHGLWGAVTESD